MKKGITISRYCIAMSLVGMGTAVALLFYHIRTESLNAFIPYLLEGIFVYIFGILFSKLVSPIKTVINIFLWKTHGFTQDNYSCFFFTKSKGITGFTSNPFSSNCFFVPSSFLSKINLNNINEYKEYIYNIEKNNYVLLLMFYIILDIFIFLYSGLPLAMIPIIAFIFEIFNSILNFKSFKGEFYILKNGEEFEYAIIRLKLLNDVDIQETTRWFLELEKENYEKKVCEIERISIWEKIILNCCENHCALPEESNYILQNRYFIIRWELYVTYETFNLFKIYLYWTIITNNVNYRKIAVNLLKRYTNEDIGKKLKNEIDIICVFFLELKGNLDSLKITGDIAFFSDFKIVNIQLLNIENYINELIQASNHK